MSKCAFLEVFPGCRALGVELCGGLEQAYLTGVVVDKAQSHMLCQAWFPRMAAPAELSMLAQQLKEIYGLNAVEIRQDFPRAESKPAKDSKGQGEVLMGKSVKGKSVPIGELTLESGNVTVEGRVFGCDSREITKAKAVVLSFCLTDGSGSIHVSRFIREGDDQNVVNKIKDGQYLRIYGNVGYTR